VLRFVNVKGVHVLIATTFHFVPHSSHVFEMHVKKYGVTERSVHDGDVLEEKIKLGVSQLDIPIRDSHAIWHIPVDDI
jgi:hypothetical protein